MFGRRELGEVRLESKKPKALYKQLLRGDLELLQQLAEINATESEILDFKLATNQGLPLEIEDKVNLSKSISGFANSGGGVLVWGVYCNENHAKADCVQELRPIAKLMGFRSSIIAASVQLVNPPVKGIDTELIFDGLDRGYLLMLIPNSSELVQSITKKGKGFYERVGTSFLEMADERLAAKAQASYRKAVRDRQLAIWLRVVLMLVWGVGLVFTTYVYFYPQIHPEVFHPVKRLPDGTVIIYPGRSDPKAEGAGESSKGGTGEKLQK